LDHLGDTEHTPTYTTGRRDNSPNPNELHPEEKKVQDVGAGFYITKRGGQVTYHGPGQLVGYPIMDLNGMEVS
jgi:lipoate-protein ligase B